MYMAPPLCFYNTDEIYFQKKRILSDCSLAVISKSSILEALRRVIKIKMTKISEENDKIFHDGQSVHSRLLQRNNNTERASPELCQRFESMRDDKSFPVILFLDNVL